MLILAFSPPPYPHTGRRLDGIWRHKMLRSARGIWRRLRQGLRWRCCRIGFHGGLGWMRRVACFRSAGMSEDAIVDGFVTQMGIHTSALRLRYSGTMAKIASLPKGRDNWALAQAHFSLSLCGALKMRCTDGRKRRDHPPKMSSKLNAS